MKILLTTSTFPTGETDPVPAFVREQVVWMKRLHSDISIDVLAPHNAYSHTSSHSKHPSYDEYRFHYFWPFRWEKLAGRGIQPALKRNKLLFVQIPFLVLFQFIATYRLARKTRPDVIYAHWFTPQAITAALVAWMTKTPFAFNTHASDIIVLKPLPLSRHLVTWVCKQAYFYTACSLQTAAKLRYFETDRTRTAMERKLHIIPMGAAPEKASAAAIKAARKEFGISKDQQILLFMGRLVDRKGIDLLIDAFANLAPKHPKLILIIAGDGQERASFVQQVNRLGLYSRVIFTGFVSGQRKAALHTISDITCVPSINVGHHSEGLPIVFMEAIIYNTVTVISNVTGAHETVEDGKDSFVFPEGSVPELIVSLEKALAVAGNERFSRQIDKLSKRFLWEHVAEQHYQLLASYQKYNK